MRVSLNTLVLAAVLALCFTEPVLASPERGVEIDDLTDLVEFTARDHALALSPDGARVAFITRTRDVEHDVYVHRLHALELAAPNRMQTLAQAGDIILSSTAGRRSGSAIERAPLWSPDGRWIAYLAENDGRAELWRVRSDGRGAQRLLGADADVRTFRWIELGEALIAETGASRAELNARRERARRLGFHPSDAYEPIYSLAPALDDTAGDSWRIDMRTRALTHIAAAPDGAQQDLAWIAPRDPAQAGAWLPALALYARSPTGAQLCAEPACEGRLLRAWAEDGDEIYFQREIGHDGALTEIAAWRLDGNNVRSIRVAEERLLGCVLDHDRLICLQDASLQPQRVVAISLEDGALTSLYDPNPSWSAFTLPRVERLDTTNSTGEASFAHLVYPLDYEPGRTYPLVIVQYRSRGFLRAGVGGEYPILPLSTRGYFVLSVERPEPRLNAVATMSPQRALLQSALDGSESQMKVEAIESFLSTLEARHLIDSYRIAITGMSDGAETLFDLLRTRRHFAAAVTSTPPSDPSSWWLRSRAFRQGRGGDGLTAPWREESAPWTQWWRNNSAANNADELTTPILFNLSETELLSSLPLIVRLEERQAPYDLYVYPGAYHSKWRPAQVRAAQRRALAWIDFWLNGRECDDSDDPQRRERWRVLRGPSE